MDFYLQNGDYLASLLKALVCNEKPQPPKFDIDWEDFFFFCKHHKVCNMVYLTIKDFDVPKDVMTKFADYYYKLSVREAKQELFAQKIFRAFEREHISYLPIKGILIKHLYPVVNYRSSNDIDILIKDKDFEKAQKVLENMSFQGKLEHTDNNDYHIEYHNKSIAVEIHSALAPTKSNHYKYFCAAFDKAIKCDGSDYRYKMTDEDFYIYVLYHLYKHFIKGGVGVRYFLDMYLIEKKMTFERKYLKEQLKKIGLFEFDNAVREIYKMLFDNGEQTDRLRELARFVYISGAHGEKTFFAMSEFSGAGTNHNNYLFNKIKYFKKAWFIGRSGMTIRYPVLKKHGWLLPFCYIHKGFSTIFRKPAAIKEQINEVKSLNKEKNSYVEHINRLAGL